jgi:hypothetical protein
MLSNSNAGTWINPHGGNGNALECWQHASTTPRTHTDFLINKVFHNHPNTRIPGRSQTKTHPEIGKKGPRRRAGDLYVGRTSEPARAPFSLPGGVGVGSGGPATLPTRSRPQRRVGGHADGSAVTQREEPMRWRVSSRLSLPRIGTERASALLRVSRRVAVQTGTGLSNRCHRTTRTRYLLAFW